MKKKLGVALAGALLLLAVLLISGAFSASKPDPIYAGKPESYWIKSLANHVSPAYLTEWTQLGSNSTPVLLAALEVRNNPLGNLGRKVWPRLPNWARSRWSPPLDVPAVQSNVVNILYGNRDIRTLCHLLHSHRDPAVRDSAAWAMSNFYEKEVTDALLEALNDQAAIVRGSAAMELSIGGRDPDVAVTVPALIKRLRDKDARVRENAAASLLVFPSNYHTANHVSNNAKVAAALNVKPDERLSCIKILVAARSDKDSKVQEAATTWLYTIAPEVAERTSTK